MERHHVITITDGELTVMKDALRRYKAFLDERVRVSPVKLIDLNQPLCETALEKLNEIPIPF